MPVTRTSWKKGQSGNPRGRPRRGSCLADLLRRELERTGPAGVTHKEALVNALVETACEGDLRAIDMIFDRVEGRPKQRQEVSGPEAGPLLLGAHISDEELIDMIRRILRQQDEIARSTSPTALGAPHDGRETTVP
jgi:Family of unknown function (DUF5681)